MPVRVVSTVFVIVASVLASETARAQSTLEAEGWPTAPQPLAEPRSAAPTPHAQSSSVSMPRVRPAARPVRVEASTETGRARPVSVGPAVSYVRKTFMAVPARSALLANPQTAW